MTTTNPTSVFDRRSRNKVPAEKYTITMNDRSLRSILGQQATKSDSLESQKSVKD